MNTYTLVMILSVALFFFVVLPELVISVALGVFIWLFAIGMFPGVGLEGEIRSELNESDEERNLKRKVDSVSLQDMGIQRQRK